MRDARRRIEEYLAVRFLWSLACLAACNGDEPRDDAKIPDGPAGMLEELSIPVGGTVVSSTVVLQSGVRYRLRASGTYFYAAAQNVLGDAEYFGFNAGGPTDTEAGVDVGLAVNDSVVDANRMPKWGAYTDTHVYEVEWTGAGATIDVQLHDGNYSNNVGSLTVAIFMAP
jgi:hypothetical protein